MFKNYGVKDWVSFAETYGMPLRLGKYDGNATAEDRKVLLRAVREIGSDAAGIIPKSMDINFIDGKQGNSDGALFQNQTDRSEERRVGQECVSTCRFRWPPYHSTKTQDRHN